MEGPDIDGPKVWIDLNRKCEAKIIAFNDRNKVKDCESKLDTKPLLRTSGKVCLARPVSGGL